VKRKTCLLMDRGAGRLQASSPSSSPALPFLSSVGNIAFQGVRGHSLRTDLFGREEGRSVWMQ
jgi:hypothetical protein